MIIQFKNFKCYEDKTIEILDKGMVLISGPSGSGKSTIFQGVLFCLYGIGTKVTTYNKKSCFVSIEYNDLFIKRTKTPNRLTVFDKKSNKTYDDIIAQEMLNGIFSNVFKNTSYMDQNIYSSFILLSPLEKLLFIEKFAFKDINLEIIKENLKKLIKDRHNKMLTSQGELTSIQTLVDNTNKPEEVKFPIKCKKSLIPKVIKNENIKHKNGSILIKRSMLSLTNINKEISDITIMTKEIDHYQNTIHDYLNDLKTLEENNIIYCGDDELEKMENTITNVKNWNKLQELKNTYSSLYDKINDEKRKEDFSNKETLENLNKLCKDNSVVDIKEKIEKLEEQYANFMEYNKIIEKLKSLTNDITNDDIENKEEKLLRYKDLLEKQRNLKTIYNCPNCNIQVKLDNGILCKTDECSNDKCDISIDDLVKKISLLEVWIKHNKLSIQKRDQLTIEKKHIYSKIKNFFKEDIKTTSMKSIKNMLEDNRVLLNDTKLSIKNINNIRNRIENKIYNDKIIYMEKELNKYQLELDKLEENIEETTCKESFSDIDLINLEKTIQNEKVNKKLLMNQKENVDNISSKIVELKTKIKKSKEKHIQVYECINNIDELEKNKLIKENEITDLELQQKVYEENLCKIELYNKYKEDQEKYDNIIDLLKSKSNELDNSLKEYEISLKFKEQMLSCESLAILSVIETININANLYLEKFFPEDNMSVNLKTFKENKKSKTTIVKSQICLDIEYKDIIYDINMLSGGELSRIVLAFTLSLFEMFNSPLLLLDECTSSLDQETTSLVFNTVKETFNDKLILIIAHQVIEGNYDQVIKIK